MTTSASRRRGQMGHAAQATYQSAVDLHKAVMSNICAALNRPLREPHPEEATALVAKADLLVSGVAVDQYARVMVQNEASKLYEALRRSSARILCRRLTASRRRARNGTWRLQSYHRGFCPQRKRCKVRSYTVKCLQNSRPSCSVQGDRALARAGRPCTNRRQNWHRMRSGGWPRRCDLVLRPMLDHARRVLCGKAAVPPFHLFCCKYG